MRLFTYESFRNCVFEILRQLQQIKATINNEAFYCNALAGESSYNIVINSDLTVSCNCTDYYGEGQLGDLNKQNFREIFDGQKATHFRKQLAKGKLPITKCTLCMDKRTVSKKESEKYISRYCLPYKGLMVENTIRCNLKCLACPRESLLKTRQQKQMSLEDITRVAHVLKDLNLESIAYFNLGEPFFSINIFEEIKIIKSINPRIRIILSTNGVLLDSDEKREAAMLMDDICVSIDGSTQKSTSKYQINTFFKKTYQNVKDLVEYRNSRGSKRPQIAWKYVLFNWNDKKKYIDLAITLAKEAGVDLIFFCPTLTPPYGISWRYYSGKFRDIGVKTWRGREVWFNQ